MTNHKLNLYMGYVGDPREGAALIFAHTAKEAKRLFWKSGWASDAGEFTDARATRLRDRDYLYGHANKAKLEAGLPHVIESPNGCDACETWGQSEIGDDGLCDECRDERETCYGCGDQTPEANSEDGRCFACREKGIKPYGEK